MKNTGRHLNCIGSQPSQKLTQVEGDDNWNIEWKQQGTLIDSVMYNALHFLERKMSRCSTRS